MKEKYDLIAGIIIAIIFIIAFIWITHDYKKAYKTTKEFYKQKQEEYEKYLKLLEELAINDYEYLNALYFPFLSKHCDTMIAIGSGDKIYWNHVKLLYLQKQL